MSCLNIVFAGTPEFGVPTLNALFDSEHFIKAIYTQPDRPAGRGQTLQMSAVKRWAFCHEVSVAQPAHFKNHEAIEALQSLQPDVMIVVAYGLILPKEVLEIPRFGCINVHASLLPRWRGASPIQQAILHGDQETGVTIMQMDVGMDTGAMWAKVACPVLPNDTAGTLHDKLAQLAAKPLLDVLDRIQCHQNQPESQKNDLVTCAPKITKENARINWALSAVEIDRVVRAYHPWPIAYTQFGDQLLRIHQAKIMDAKTSKTPGTVLSLDKQGVLIATGDGTLLVEKIQFSSAKVIAVSDYMNAGKKQLDEGLILQ